MTGRGVQRSVSALVDVQGFYALGIVTAIEEHADLGWLATVALQPSGHEVQARVAQLGSTAGGGLFFPVAVDDEVEVLFPDGDPNRAVCRAGLVSSASAPPSSYDNTGPQLVHAEGMEFRTAGSASVQPVVLETLLPDLSSAMTEILAIFGALSSLGIALPSTSTAQLITNLATAYRSAAIQTE